MSDRFKFRAWDKINNEWVKIPHLSLDVETGMLNGFFDYTEAAKRRYTLEQCTGLRDKNGKLIYEGDIILVEDNKCPIEWESENARYNVVGYGEIAYLNYNDIEVIGNIHKNPELLEVQDE